MALWFSTSNLAPGQVSQQALVPPGNYNFIVRRDTGLLTVTANSTYPAITDDTYTTLEQLGPDGVTWQTIVVVDNSAMYRGQAIVHVYVNPAPWGAVQVVGGTQQISWCGLTDDNGNESRTIW